MRRGLVLLLGLALLVTCNTYRASNEKRFYEIESHSWGTIDVAFYCNDVRRRVERALSFNETRRGSIAVEGCLDFTFVVTMLASDATFRERVFDWSPRETLSIRVENQLPLTSFFVR